MAENENRPADDASAEKPETESTPTAEKSDTESTPGDKTSAAVQDIAAKAKSWATTVVGAASGFVSQVIGSRPWVPATDVYVTATEVVVLADLPGVSAESLTTAATAKTLTITGQCSAPELPGDGEWVQRGRNYGPFERIVELPREVRSGEIKAALKRGVLEVRMPLAVEGPQKATEVAVESDPEETA